MTLLEVLQAVKDDSLDQRELESYRDKLLMMSSDLEIECADLEKKESLFMLQDKAVGESDIAVTRRWKASTDGQRLILLKRYVRATNKACESLKQRIYSKLR